MAGYDGYSMSNNARAAYEEGKAPLSKWTKSAILQRMQENGTPAEFIQLAAKYPAEVVKRVLLFSAEWHHTSAKYNETKFYQVDEPDNMEFFSQQLEAEAVNVEFEKTAKKQHAPAPKRVHAKYAIWEGQGRHKKARWVEADGVLSGNWFVADDGTRKKAGGNWIKFEN